jgi:hypothetical protein
VTGVLFALALIVVEPAGKAAAGGSPPIPDAYQLSVLIYGSLTALDQANATGDYTVLRLLAAPSFQYLNTPADLAATFAKYRRAHMSLASIVLFQPTLVEAPRIGDDDLLRLKGFFATQPLRIGFELAYQYVEGAWRLIAISIVPA